MSKLIWIFGLITVFAAPITPPSEYIDISTKDPTILQRLEKLEFCESSGNEQAIGDSGKAFGPLQFHKPTFLHFSMKYKIFPAEQTELENLYYDPYSQRELAYRMLLDGEYEHWWNCSKKLRFIK